MNEVVIPYQVKDTFNSLKPDAGRRGAAVRQELRARGDAERGLRHQRPGQEPRRPRAGVPQGRPRDQQPEGQGAPERDAAAQHQVAGRSDRRAGSVSSAATTTASRTAAGCSDDVVDIALQVVGGELKGNPNDLGDGVNANDAAFGHDVPVPGAAGQRLDHARPARPVTGCTARRVARSGTVPRSSCRPRPARAGRPPAPPGYRKAPRMTTAAPARAARSPAALGARASLVTLGAAGLLGRHVGAGRPTASTAARSPAAAARRRSTRPPLAGVRRTTWSATLQARLRRHPEDHRAWSTLALAYVEQARITADPTYYPKAERALARAAAARARATRCCSRRAATLAAARHDFAGRCGSPTPALRGQPLQRAGRGGPLRRADRARPLRRGAARPRTRADDLDPGPSTFARLSYQAELRGDLAEATRLMRLSQEAAGTSASSYAFAAFHLGELARAAGRPGAAAAPLPPRWPPTRRTLPALAGRARLAVARGDLAAAERDYLRVVQRLPLTEYVVELGELYEATGRPELAAPAVRRGARVGPARRRQRRRHRPRDRAVRGRPRLAARRRWPPPAPSGRAGTRSTPPTRSAGRCTPPAATGRPCATPGRRPGSAPRTRGCSSTAARSRRRSGCRAAAAPPAGRAARSTPASARCARRPRSAALLGGAR